jgi:hypothetical protein
VCELSTCLVMSVSTKCDMILLFEEPGTRHSGSASGPTLCRPAIANSVLPQRSVSDWGGARIVSRGRQMALNKGANIGE